METNDCAEALQAQLYLDHWPFRLMLFFHVICNLFSVGTNVFFLCRIFSSLFLPPHIKLLLKAQITSSLVFAVFSAVLSFIHLFLFFTAHSGCDVVVSRVFCLVFKIPIDTAISSWVFLNAAIVVERFLATLFLKSFERWKVHFGVYLCGISVLFAALLSTWLHSRVSLSLRVPYCSSTNQKTLSDSMIVATILATTETLAICTFILLGAVNSNLSKRMKFVVGIRYQLDENIDVASLFLPWMLAHLSFILIYYALSILVPRSMDWSLNEMALRTVIGYCYMLMFIFGALSPLFMWMSFVWMRRRKHRRIASVNTTATGEMYYDTYRSMW